MTKVRRAKQVLCVCMYKYVYIRVGMYFQFARFNAMCGVNEHTQIYKHITFTACICYQRPLQDARVLQKGIFQNENA